MQSVGPGSRDSSGDHGRPLLGSGKYTRILLAGKKILTRQIGAIAAIAVGVDSGLWVLMARNGDKPQKVTDLAASLGVDPNLLSRLHFIQY